MILKLKSLIPLVLACLLAISTQSCFDGDDYDFDKLSEKVDWTPNMIVPVGYGTYSLWYLLNQHEANPDDQTIVLDAEGMLHIKYMEEDIFSYNVDEVLNFPPQDPQTFTVKLTSLPSVPYNSIPSDITEFTIQDTFKISVADIILTDLDLNAGMDFTFSNPLNTDVDLTIAFPSGTINGTPVSQTYTIPANGTGTPATLSLPDFHLEFASPSTENKLPIEFGVKIKDNGGFISGSGNLSISLQVQNIEFILAKGDFGTQKIRFDKDVIDMGVDFWDDIEGDYQFVNPQILLHLNNSVGVPFEINADITGYSNTGTMASLNPDAQQPAYPQTVSAANPLTIDAIVETITYDTINSNIKALMALPPSERLEYSGNVTLNPEPVDLSSPNIISKDSKISVDIEIDVPLDFTATNLVLRDTVNDIDISDADKILNAAIVIVTENGYPLDVSIDKIYLTDAAYNVIDSITDNQVIDAAEVFPAGNAQEGEVNPDSITEVEHEIVLTQSQIKNLNQTENLIINAGVSTKNNGVPVKLKGDYELKFTLSVQAQIDLNN